MYSNKVAVTPLPFGYNAGVVIRDDDLCYFTSPENLDEIYEKAWRQGFKVSFSVIPKVKAINDPLVPPCYRGASTLHEICENKELVGYLGRKLASHQVDILQHGYTHEAFGNLPEFRLNNRQEIMERLNSGREILETCLPPRIRVFVPPWDSISEKALEIVGKEDLAIVKREEKFHTQLRFNIISSRFGKFLDDPIFSLIGKENRSVVQKTAKVKDVGSSTSPEKCSLVFYEDEKRRKEKINVIKAEKAFSMLNRNMNGLFCILNHYYSYYEDWQSGVNLEMLNHFYSLLDEFNKPNIWKTTFTEVVDWIRKRDKVRVEISEKKVILQSPVAIEGLTIKGEDYQLIPDNEDDITIKELGSHQYLIFSRVEAGETREIHVKRDHP
jgi:hypothetical protein